MLGGALLALYLTWFEQDMLGLQHVSDHLVIVTFVRIIVWYRSE